MRAKLVVGCLGVAALIAGSSSQAMAAEELGASASSSSGDSSSAQESPKENRVGGHIGMAIQLVTVGQTTQVIGADYATIGLAPGVTIKIDDHWIADFEFVAYSNFKTNSLTSLVIDPGILYDFGFAVAGVRAAMHIGGGQTNNFGVIPIILKGFPIGPKKEFKFFVELDLPVFFNENGAALTVQPQMGLAF